MNDTLDALKEWEISKETLEHLPKLYRILYRSIYRIKLRKEKPKRSKR
jgi:acyl-[acyl carrier protein]--UDP-N-acetylglucosamine O-acyltransferase